MTKDDILKVAAASAVLLPTAWWFAYNAQLYLGCRNGMSACVQHPFLSENVLWIGALAAILLWGNIVGKLTKDMW